MQSIFLTCFLYYRRWTEPRTLFLLTLLFQLSVADLDCLTLRQSRVSVHWLPSACSFWDNGVVYTPARWHSWHKSTHYLSVDPMVICCSCVPAWYSCVWSAACGKLHCKCGCFPIFLVLGSKGLFTLGSVPWLHGYWCASNFTSGIIRNQ